MLWWSLKYKKGGRSGKGVWGGIKSWDMASEEMLKIPTVTISTKIPCVGVRQSGTNVGKGTFQTLD